MEQSVRQKIGIGFASLAVAMFAVALLSALNEPPPDEADEQSSLIADEPIPTDFLNVDEDALTPVPTTPGQAASTTRRATSSNTRRAPAAAAPAPTPTPAPEGTVPPEYLRQWQSCGGNGSHGDSGGGGGGCGGGAPGAAPPDGGIDAGGGGEGGNGGDSD